MILLAGIKSQTLLLYATKLEIGLLPSSNALLNHAVYLFSHDLAVTLKSLKINIRDPRLNMLLKVEDIGFIRLYFLL